MNAVVVDTGVFSAPFSHRRNSIASLYDRHLRSNLLVLASQTVADFRYGALVAGWGPSRLAELDGCHHLDQLWYLKPSTAPQRARPNALARTLR